MNRRWAFAIILAAYSAILFRVLVFKNLRFNVGHVRVRIAQQSGQANLVPFRTIVSYLHDPNRAIAVVNLLGNIVLFIPIGCLAPLVFRRMTWLPALALALAAGLAVEGAQALLQVGEFDIDDLMLNAVGVLIGYSGSMLVARRRAYA